jgi:hypothetical protein
MQQETTILCSGERKIYTRLPEVLIHINYFSFQGQARLAYEAGYARSTIHRLIHGKCQPSFALVHAIQQVLDRRLGKPLATEEWLSLDGRFPTASICRLVGCRGCLPDQAYNEDDTMKPEYQHVTPGQWSLLHPPCPAPREVL